MTDLTQSFAGRNSLIDRFSAIKTNIAERYARHRLYQRSLSELASLSDRDLADIGLSRHALRASIREALYNDPRGTL